MQKKNGQIAHRTILPTSQREELLRNSAIRHAQVISAPASPWQNPYVERLIGSIRCECLDHVIVLNAPHLRRVLTIYSRYYHRGRTHLGLEKDAPDPRPVSPPSAGRIIAIPEVGGLHTAMNGGRVSARPSAEAGQLYRLSIHLARLVSSTILMLVGLPSIERDLTVRSPRTAACVALPRR
jgi:integrase-like protein